jgi:site-specific recombinase XerD
MSRPSPQGLPPFAVEYLATEPKSRRVVRWFHAWLKRTGRSILQLEPLEIDPFLKPILAAHHARRGRELRRRLFRYFDWLHARKLLPFPAALLEPRGFELPATAVRFVSSLEPTLKPATVNQHRTSLRHFHSWLDSQQLTVQTLDRSHVSAWLQWLHARHIGACHRIHLILSVRAYFRWLEEQPDYAAKPTSELFRQSDFPKLPQYLPRPVPADLDRALQARLRKSGALPQLGLLLMRRTGLRVGELRRLPIHCVHTDDRGRKFLKVPLGKLNNERLVPLDRRTITLLERLRRVGSHGRRGRRRTLLLESSDGKAISYATYREQLGIACKGLTFAEPMTTHRLRHTFATSMLVAGVSLPVLMKLLGHRDYRMTLRYAAITIETVASEYSKAVEHVEVRYRLHKIDNDESSPTDALTNLARYLSKNVVDAGLDKGTARVLIRRLQRLNTAVERLLRECSRRSARSD